MSVVWTILGGVSLVGGLFAAARWPLRGLVGDDLSSVENRKILWAYTSGLLAASVGGAIWLAGRFSPGEAAAAVIPAAEAVVATGTNAAAIASVAIAGGWAVLRGVEPVLEDVRDSPRTVPSIIRRRNWLLGGGCLAAFAVGVAATFGPVNAHLGWLAILTVGLYLGVYDPYVEPFPWFLHRDPTAEERERIERCYERFGRSPPAAIFVSEREDHRSHYHGATLRGIGGARSLVVDESLLETADGDELAVVLAQADERFRRRYHTVSSIHDTAVFVALLGFVQTVFLRPSSALFVLLFLVPLTVHVLSIPLSRRLVYRADQSVSDRLGAETVRRTYGDLTTAVSGEQNRMLQGTPAVFVRYLWPEPPVERRLARLDDATDSSGGTGAGPTNDGEPSD